MDLHIGTVTPLLSLITCSRDPDNRAFERTLASVRALRVPAGWRVEHLIVDNASAPPLASRGVVTEHLAQFGAARLVTDATDGLALVRARAIVATEGELLVTVDDDNELDAGYLEALVAAATDFPRVGAFGAGHIHAELPASAPAWAHDPWITRLFQERAIERATTGSSRSWQLYYPPGTGMAVRREIAVEFARAVGAGVFRNPSRRATQLGGGEDAQLVWLCVRDGWELGAFPGMRVSHLVLERRLSARYVAQLVFGIHQSAAPARCEVLRDEPLPTLTPWRALLRGMRAVAVRAPLVVMRAQCAAALGDAAALCLVHERPEPWWLRALIALFRVR